MSRAGYVLVGGRSARMGRDKALLQFHGEALATYVARTVEAAAGSAVLVGDPLRYRHLGLEVIPDLYPGQGPLGGILTVLHHTSADWNLVTACDMPELSEGFLRELLEAAELSGAHALVPRGPGGVPETLCAVYHRGALARLEQAFTAGERKVAAALEGLRVAALEVEEVKPFQNVNTPQDWAGYVQEGSYPHYIEFRHVYKTFDKPVLVDSNFHVNAGETVAIIGRSGVGKSVTLSHIMGFLKPDSGRVVVAHEDITDFEEPNLRRIRKKVTMVFQSGALFDSLTVAENVLFSLELREDYDAQNKEDVVDGLLDMVDILQARDVYPSDLSTGYKRAVAIARALAAQPQCVLYDEPTTMVDPIMSDHLSDLMLRLKKQLKLTSVVVTHDLDLMYKVADRVVVLYEGTVIFFGPVADLEKSDHPHIREFLEMDRVVKV